MNIVVPKEILVHLFPQYMPKLQRLSLAVNMAQIRQYNPRSYASQVLLTHLGHIDSL